MSYLKVQSSTDAKDEHVKAHLFFLHGFLGRAQEWQFFAKSLEKDFKSSLISLPGHLEKGVEEFDSQAMQGLSFDFLAKELEELVSKETELPKVIVSYSLGARIALETIFRKPTLFSACVFESPSVGIEDRASRLEREQLDRKRSEELREGEFAEFLRAWYAQPVFSKTYLTEEVLENRIKECENYFDKLLLALVLERLSPGKQEYNFLKLKDIKAPSLILVGERDQKFREKGLSISKELEKGKLVLVSKASHNVHQDAPMQFLNNVRTFLNEVFAVRR